MTLLADLRMSDRLRDFARRIGIKTVAELREAFRARRILAQSDRREAEMLLERHIHPPLDWRAEVLRVHEKAKGRIAPWTQDDRRFLALKLAGEAGMLANLIAREWRGDHHDQRAYVANQLSDIRRYLELLAAWHGLDLDAVCTARLADLYRRHPEAAPPAPKEGTDA